MTEPASPEEFKSLKHEPPIKAEIRIERGGPRLFVNGAEVYPLFAWSWRLLKVTPDFKSAGINIIYPILQVSDGWRQPEAFDWAQFDSFFARLLSLNPHAFFLPRLLLYLPDWWKDRHPESLIQTCYPFDESRNISTPELLIGEGGQRWWRDNPRESSFASPAFREDTATMLRKFLQHYEASPLRSRIIGYHIGLGTTGGEWHYSHASFLPDLNPKMAEKLGYVPEAKERLFSSYGLFRDPHEETRTIEFYRKFHALNADTILYFARILKQETGRRLLCGVFYNYLLENVWMQEGGHLCPEPILKSDDIDFIASPYTYQGSNVKGSKQGETDVFDHAGNWLGRGRGVAGDGGYRILIESVKRHGKLPMVEMDPATFVDANRDPNFAGSGSNTLQGSIKLLQRDLGQLFASGCGGWLCDIGSVKGDGWYSATPIIKAIRKLAELGDIRKYLDLSSVAQIAAVYDAKTFFVTRHWRSEEVYEKGARYMDYFGNWFLNSQSRALHRIGAPVDFLYRFDLKKDDVKKYQLFLMVNSFYLTSDEVKTLRTIFRDSGAIVVWFYAPGFVSLEKLDVQQMQHLTGFSFDILTKPGSMMIECRLPGEPNSLPNKFGIESERYPRFAVNDPAAQPLGFWQDQKDAVAFAIKEVEGWHSVYVGTAPLPVEILRWLAQKAGIALWSTQPDIIYATEDAITLIATNEGQRILKLPKPMTEVTGGERASVHHLTLEFGEVKIFAAKKYLSD